MEMDSPPAGDSSHAELGLPLELDSLPPASVPVPVEVAVPDMFWINVALGCFVVLLTWAIYAVHYHYIARPKSVLKKLRKQGIKGYPFRPFVGQLFELFQMMKKRNEDPAYAAATEGTQFFTDSQEKYGNVFTFCWGSEPRVVLTDPALVRQVYVQMNDSFPKTEFLRKLKLMQNGLVLVNGTTWTTQRRLINPAFNHKEIKRIFPTIVHCAQGVMKKMEALVRRSPGGETLEMDLVWSKLTLDIIIRSAFGLNIEELVEGDPISALIGAFTEYPEVVLQSLQFSLILPFFSYLPFKVNRRLEAVEQVIRGTMEKIISARVVRRAQQQQEQEQRGGSAGVVPEDGDTDLLELMMSATEGLSKAAAVEPLKGSQADDAPSSGTEEPKGSSKKLSVEALVANSITFLLAGHETTATMLTWTCLLLSQHPEWQEKARAEVEAVFKENGGKEPTFEQLSELKIVGWILNESLRLFPPAPLTDRTALVTSKLSDDVTIPAGCDVMIPIGVIHRDKALWGEDANEFRPNRFANGVAKAASHPSAFMPFTLGPRTCIGQSFAIAEGKVLLALFLHRFKWKLSERYRHHSEHHLTLRAKKGLPLELTLVQ